MRVTNKMLSNSFLSDMRTNLSNLQTLQQQMTSGKEIRKPSDDPARVARAMQLHTDINANNQYKENINDTLNWLDTTDTALGQAGNILQRVRELMVQAGNAAYGADEKKSIKNEINQRIDEFAQVLNTSFDGKYIFGGTRGTTKPLATVQASGNNKLVYNSNTPSIELAIPDKSSSVFYNADGTFKQADYDTAMAPYLSENQTLTGKLPVEISPGVTMEYNVSAKEVLEFDNEKGASKDIRTIFKNIVDHLDSGSTSSLTGTDLQDMTDAITNILKKRSEVGAKQNRMESAQDKNTEETFNLTAILSRTEDIDITEKTMQYATLQTVYMASLQTSAKVIQPSLLDYLR
jgi:flagellar hook-associated protein 3 FlgL